MPIPDELVEILACPKCHGGLRREADPEGFGCEACGLFYAVEDGIPNFLIDEAVPWGAADRRAAREGR